MKRKLKTVMVSKSANLTKRTSITHLNALYIKKRLRHVLRIFFCLKDKHNVNTVSFFQILGAVVVVIVWDLLLPMQSVPITTKVVSSYPTGEVYSIQHYVIKFVSDVRQVGGFLWVLRFPPPKKLITTI